METTSESLAPEASIADRVGATPVAEFLIGASFLSIAILGSIFLAALSYAP